MAETDVAFAEMDLVISSVYYISVNSSCNVLRGTPYPLKALVTLIPLLTVSIAALICDSDHCFLLRGDCKMAVVDCDLREDLYVFDYSST